MKEYQPQDATTNPSLILQAASKPEYKQHVQQAIDEHKNSDLSGDALIESIIDRLLVIFGMEILKIVPGRVSTETDARLSFNTQGTIEKARQLIGIYEKEGVSRERVLIKIASTWEGIKAAEELESRAESIANITYTAPTETGEVEVTTDASESGNLLSPEQRSAMQHAGRNDPCPCGSGKKFKQCHGKLN